MRVLVSAVGTRGDAQPALALACALRTRGHEVRLAIPPNFVPWAQQLGFDARPLGIEMRAPALGAAPPTPEQIRQMAADLITNQFDVVLDAAEGCDRIVGAGVHQYAVRSIGELRRIPVALAVYAPTSLPAPELAPIAGRWEDVTASWNARSLERVNANRARLGLGAIPDVLGHILGDRPWLATDTVLGPAPIGLDVLQTGAWILEDRAPLPGSLDAFLRAGEPPIYVGLGSMPAPKEISRALIEAARAAGRRVILSKGWADLEVIDDADDCIAIGDVNHHALFPRVAAVVHHGGAGTTTAVARASVPQVIVPMFGDQFYWGARIEQLGVGQCVPSRGMSAVSLAAALRASLAAGVALRAQAIEVSVNGADVAAEAVSRME